MSLATGESHVLPSSSSSSLSPTQSVAAWFYRQCSLCHCSSLFQDGRHHPLATQHLCIDNTDGFNHPANQCSPYPLSGSALGSWSLYHYDCGCPHTQWVPERGREKRAEVFTDSPLTYCGYLPYCWLCWPYCQGSGIGSTSHTSWAFQCFIRICHWYNVQLSGESLPPFPEETERLFLLRNGSLVHPIS